MQAHETDLGTLLVDGDYPGSSYPAEYEAMAETVHRAPEMGAMACELEATESQSDNQQKLASPWLK